MVENTLQGSQIWRIIGFGIIVLALILVMVFLMLGVAKKAVRLILIMALAAAIFWLFDILGEAKDGGVGYENHPDTVPAAFWQLDTRPDGGQGL